MINSADRIPRSVARVVGHRISVASAGDGPPVVFIHGNATYSYTWRNVVPYLTRSNRVLAPDLPGMGRSDLMFPSGATSYGFEDQTALVELFIETHVPDGPVVVVGHELGALIAAQFARKNPHRTAGLAMIEGVIRITNDSTIPDDVAEFLAQVRSDQGEIMVLQENQIIERYLPRMTLRVLGPAEMDAYRLPYAKGGESRRAMLSMIRQLPLKTMPGPIDELAEQTRLWCAQSKVPKLVIGGKPGFLVTPPILGTTARWANVTTASVRGAHFLMEDSPARLTAAILDWLGRIGHVR